MFALLLSVITSFLRFSETFLRFCVWSSLPSFACDAAGTVGEVVVCEEEAGEVDVVVEEGEVLTGTAEDVSD